MTAKDDTAIWHGGRLGEAYLYGSLFLLALGSIFVFHAAVYLQDLLLAVFSFAITVLFCAIFAMTGVAMDEI